MKCDDKEAIPISQFKPESPLVIVCEGFQDSGLICAMLRHLNITNCDVTFPKKKRDGANGKEGISTMVGLLAEVSTVRGIAIIRDADGDSNKSFNEARSAFTGNFNPPSEAFVVERAKHRTTAIFLMPGRGKQGAIEHLLLTAVFAKHPSLATCVDAFERCNQGIANWPENKKAKMKMQCVIASYCKSDPGCSLGFIWQKGAENPIDLSSEVFQELADFLVAFTT